MASCLQYPPDCFYGRIVYIDIGCLRNWSCNSDPGSAVHPAWTGDTPDPDPGGRTGGDRMCDSLFSYFTEKDYGKRKDCYPGDL